jgi:hypothetical protein
MNMNKENLYGWVFMYNPYKEQWMAATRDNYFLLTSDSDNKAVLKSSRIETLVELIAKTNGKESELRKIVKYKD